jgi:hypothetical protein
MDSYQPSPSPQQQQQQHAGGSNSGVLTVSAMEVQQLKAELQKQQAYIAVKNDEIVSLSQQLAQAGAELTKQKMLVAQLQSTMQANETSPEMQRYVQPSACLLACLCCLRCLLNATKGRVIR